MFWKRGLTMTEIGAKVRHPDEFICFPLKFTGEVVLQRNLGSNL